MEWDKRRAHLWCIYRAWFTRK